jgi:beta-galactosidase
LLKIARLPNDLRPVLATEYAHAMGNALGNFQDYWDEIYSNPRLLGGFIWEWCDQGLHKIAPDGTTFTAIGGDFGDVPNHGGFCIKGLVSAERVPFPKYWEVKKVYQPVAITGANLHPGRVAIRLLNRNAFVNLDTQELRWSVTGDGVEIQSGILPPVSVAPEQTVTVKIPVASISPADAATEYYLRVSLHTRANSLWAAAGFETAWQQLRLASPPPGKAARLPVTDYPPLALQCATNGDTINIDGSHFNLAFSRTNGTLTSLNYSGREMLAPSTPSPSGPILQAFRAPTDNDKAFGKWLARDWRAAGLTNLLRHVESFTLRQPVPWEIQLSTLVNSQVPTGGFNLVTRWTIHSNGTLDMDNQFIPYGTLPLLPRLGVVLRLSDQLERLQWLGRGPWENYPDRKESADAGLWNSTVSDQYVPYVHPQENGNKEEVRRLILSNGHNAGLEITTLAWPFAFSALHYTAADLAAVRHKHELKTRPETILSLDAIQCGLGNSSCGPGVLAKYSVPPDRTYELHLRFQAWSDLPKNTSHE